MTSLKPYPDYKDSGVEWLGKVPSLWEVRPSKSVFGLRNEVERPGDTHLTPSQNLGVLPQAQYMEITGNKLVLALAGTRMKHVEANDFIIHLRSFQGGIEHSSYSGKVSPAYTVIYPKFGVVPEYFRYCLKSRGYVDQIASLTDQLRDGQSMRYYDFGQTPLPLPSETEQRWIADYLDHETAEIDAFIADQQELITLLNERRTATITEAVTKGVHPNVQMKESGVEWLGQVPEHWELVPLKWSCRLITGLTPSTTEEGYYSSTEQGIQWIRPEDIDESGRPTVGSKFLTEAGASQVRLLRPGVVLVVGIGATLGKVGITQHSAATNQQITALDSDEYVDKYLFFVLQAAYEVIKLASMGNTLPIINNSRLGSIIVPKPPQAEQRLIVDEVHDEICEIDAAIADAREAITLSKERRAALISAAVTGKIDVRGYSASARSKLQGEPVGAA